MNVAFCFSGKLIEKINYNFLNHFINYDNVDIFFHFWDSIKNKDLIDTLKPKKYIIESQIDFTNEANQAEKHLIDNDRGIDWKWDRSKKIITDNYDYLKTKYFFSQISMYYSIFQANLLKLEYENLNKIKYDFVIRIRPDLTFGKNDKIDFKKLKKNICYLKTDSLRKVNDVFAVGDSNIMNIYASVYPSYYNLFKSFYFESDLNYFCNESILYQNILKNKIVYENLDVNISILR